MSVATRAFILTDALQHVEATRHAGELLSTVGVEM